MLAQPQPLAKHFLECIADRITGVIARDGFDFLARGAQARLERVGGVEELAHGTLTVTPSAAQHEHNGGDDDHGDNTDLDGVQGDLVSGMAAVCRWCTGPANAGRGISDARRPTGLTRAGSVPNIPRLMSKVSAVLPEPIDAWRMVASRREMKGHLPLSAFKRLAGSLFDTEGTVTYALDFDTDALRVPYVEVRIEARLPLLCQRTLQRFELPVSLVQRLGLLRNEDGEAGLPEGYEPLLMPADGLLSPGEVVEDELILVVPVVALAPGTEAMEADWPPPEEESAQANPFAALASLKSKSS